MKRLQKITLRSGIAAVILGGAIFAAAPPASANEWVYNSWWYTKEDCSNEGMHLMDNVTVLSWDCEQNDAHKLWNLYLYEA